MSRSVFLTLIFLSVLPGSASAFPGANGKIALSSDRGATGDSEIFAMNADGSDQTNLTKNPASSMAPRGRPTPPRSPSRPTVTATTRST